MWSSTTLCLQHGKTALIWGIELGVRNDIMRLLLKQKSIDVDHADHEVARGGV